MKLEVREGLQLILKEIYSGIGLETEEGNLIGICMRDDTFEINIIPKGSQENNWWRVDMQKGTIEKMTPGNSALQNYYDNPEGCNNETIKTKKANKTI